MCKTIIFTNGYAIITSTAFLLVIALQRYRKICRPHSKQMSLLWRRLTVILVIFANLVYSGPSVVLSGVDKLSLVYNNVTISGTSCFTGTNKYPTSEIVYYGFVILVSIVYMLLTMVLYVSIARVIYRNFHRRRKYQQSRSNNTKNAQNASSSSQERKVSSVSGNVGDSHVSVPLSKYQKCKTNFTKMFFTIINIYFVSYIPMYVILIYTKLEQQLWTAISFSKFAIYNGLIRAYIMNHVTNPFIYIYFDNRLRQTVASLFCKNSVY